MGERWKYSGHIFDAHTHIGAINEIEAMIKIEDKYRVKKQLGIVHDVEGFKEAKQKHGDRFVFAKYLSLKDIAQYNVEPVLAQIETLLAEGFKHFLMALGYIGCFFVLRCRFGLLRGLL